MPSSLLLVSALAALLVGPVLAWVWSKGRAWRSAIDGLSLALVGGICLLLLLPHAIEHAGFPALIAAAVGLVLPTWSHRLSARWERTFAWVGLALVAAHAAVDGAALSWFEGDKGTVMGAAVVAHRLPMGLAIYSEAMRSSGRKRAGIAAIALLMGTTLLGFWAGQPLAELGGPIFHGTFEAFVAGVLMHIVFEHAPIFPSVAGEAPLHPPSCGHDHSHRAHDHGDHRAHDHGHAHEPDGHHTPAPSDASPAAAAPHPSPSGPPPSRRAHSHSHSHSHSHHSPRDVAAAADARWSALGSLAGVGIAGALVHTGHTHEEGVTDVLLSLLLESAPALLAGYLLAGLAVAFIPSAGAGWLAGRTSAGSALRGVLFGLPLPVCSCGVLPLYDTLVRRGAPVAAAMAFLVATPELGIDALILSVPLLGVPLTVARLVAAFLVALLVALLVGRGLPSLPAPVPNTPEAPPPVGERLREGLSYGFVELVDHTMPWVLLGLVAAGLAAPLLSSGWLTELPPVLQVPLFALIGIPVYVCATGATPLAAVMVQKGISAGAALALLIAGPATNITTFGLLSVLHGRRTAIKFGLAVVGLAVVAGLIADQVGVSVPVMEDAHIHAHSASPLQLVAVFLLSLVVLSSLLRQGPRGVVAQILQPVEEV